MSRRINDGKKLNSFTRFSTLVQKDFLQPQPYALHPADKPYQMRIEYHNLYTHFILTTLHRERIIAEKYRERERESELKNIL